MNIVLVLGLLLFTASCATPQYIPRPYAPSEHIESPGDAGSSSGDAGSAGDAGSSSGGDSR